MLKHKTMKMSKETFEEPRVRKVHIVKKLERSASPRIETKIQDSVGNTSNLSNKRKDFR